MFQGPVAIKQNEISDLHTDFPKKLLATDPAISLSIACAVSDFIWKKKKKKTERKTNKPKNPHKKPKLFPFHKYHISIVSF